MRNFLAEVCDVDDVLASAFGFGCRSGCGTSGSPIDLCGSSVDAGEAPLGTSGLPINIYSSSDDDEGLAPLTDEHFLWWGF